MCTFRGLFSMWQNIEHTLISFSCCWASSHCCKSSKIEQVFWPSGNTDCFCRVGLEMTKGLFSHKIGLKRTYTPRHAIFIANEHSQFEFCENFFCLLKRSSMSGLVLSFHCPTDCQVRWLTRSHKF